VAKKDDFRNYKQWMHKHKPEQFEVPTPDEPIRTGKYSNMACYNIYQMQIGDGMYSNEAKVRVKDKHISFSVVQEPFAMVDPMKESGGPMHISAGIIDHIIADCRAELRCIDEEFDPFIQELRAFRLELKAYFESPATAAEDAQQYHDQQYAQLVDRARNQLARLQSNENTSQEAIAAAEGHLNNALAGRYSHATSSGLGLANKLRKGTKEVFDAAESMFEQKKYCGASEYVFNKAIELTGARYRKEHGGMSLSNSHSLLVAEHHLKIATAVEATYPNHPAIQQRVRKLMQMFRRLCEPAFKISVLLKRQGKLDDRLVKDLKDSVCNFAKAFREELPKKKPYPKLHWLECILVDYAETHGFIGLGSEEGFESAHNRLSWIKKLLFSMPFNKDRGIKMGQRYQVSLLPEFDQIWQKLCPTSKKERGPYNVQSAEEKQSKQLERISSVGNNGHFGMITLESGNMIYETWKEKYHYVAFQAATSEMKSLLQTNPVFQEQHNPRLCGVIEYI
jgi:hypothetical protein